MEALSGLYSSCGNLNQVITSPSQVASEAADRMTPSGKRNRGKGETVRSKVDEMI